MYIISISDAESWRNGDRITLKKIIFGFYAVSETGLIKWNSSPNTLCEITNRQRQKQIFNAATEERDYVKGLKIKIAAKIDDQTGGYCHHKVERKY